MPNTREKLIELLDALIQPGQQNTLGEIADYFIANGVTVQKWIPVSERLPEEDGNYLCFTGLTYRILGFAKDGNKVSKYDLRNLKNIWYAYDSEYGYYRWEDVNHWMPLPEPPKGE